MNRTLFSLPAQSEYRTARGLDVAAERHAHRALEIRGEVQVGAEREPLGHAAADGEVDPRGRDEVVVPEERATPCAGGAFGRRGEPAPPEAASNRGGGPRRVSPCGPFPCARLDLDGEEGRT